MTATMFTDELQDIAMQSDGVTNAAAEALLKKWRDQFDAAQLPVQDVVQYLESSAAAHYTIVSRDPSELLERLHFLACPCFSLVSIICLNK